MQMDDPPYLSVGTAVSAKYKGAFCEAKVSKVERVVKCKVTFKTGLGAATVSDNEIKGTLRVGQQVLVKHPDFKDLVEATITKIQDSSQYTVVFDDGDITTLRRSALCLKSGRHFNESETLDQLPLTHPEHFGIPVMGPGTRRGRRNRLMKDESSEEEVETVVQNRIDLEVYAPDIGRVVSVETGETKRGKEKWFPGLIVIPSAQPTVKINVKEEFLIRSFRDDRYYTVPKKEVNEYNRDSPEKIDSSGLAEAVQKANKFLDNNELPLHWEKRSLFNITTDTDSDDDNGSETEEDDEPSEEKDRFVAQLYKYMDDSGTPLNKTPTVSNKDIDLHRLFRVVEKMGGYNRVTNQSKWKTVAHRLKLTHNHHVSNQIKAIYKRCLLSYEGFFKTLGVTMMIPTKPAKKDKGRSLIRDKDRTPMSSPRPERDDDFSDKSVERKTPLPEKIETKIKRKPLELKEKDPVSVKKVKQEGKDSDVSDTPSTSSIRPKRVESKLGKDKKIKPAQGEKVKALVDKFESETIKKDEKVQFTRSKSVTNIKAKDIPSTSKDMVTTRQNKEVMSVKPVQKIKKTPIKEEETLEKEKKIKIKKKSEGEKPLAADFNEPLQTANIGDKLIVYYGPTNESKVTYEAKVVDIDKDASGPVYLVHYTGWNTRYDEWIQAYRIAENLSAGTKTKRCKIPAPVNVKPASGGPPSASTSKQPVPGKRNRLTSSSSRGPSEDKTPRSTTPSSVTSSGSTAKSPATRSIRLAAKNESKRRRVSAPASDASVHSDSDSDTSESDTGELELSRTRSGSLKADEPELRVYRKRISKPTSVIPAKNLKKKDEDTEKGDESSDTKEKFKLKKPKASPLKTTDESDDEDCVGHPKGRDFDLNQIRSELKGFSKALKVSPVDQEKESVSSSDECQEKSTLVPGLLKDVKVEKEESFAEIKVEKEEPQEKAKTPPLKLEKSSSSEDIYEFKEPEPFEFESRSKLGDDKISKKRIPRIFDSPRRDTRSPLSPGKSEKLVRTYSRLHKKIHISEDEDEPEDEDLIEEEPQMDDSKNDDPFDKLIESPSFNILSKSNIDITKAKPISFSEDLTLLKDPPETSDEYSRDMDLSDCESQQTILTREDTLFSNTFSKSSPDRNTPDFASSKTDEGKTTNSDDDDIQAQIQRAIAQSSSTDEESNDALINMPPDTAASPKKVDDPVPTVSTPTKIISAVTLALGTPGSEPSKSPRTEKDPIIEIEPSVAVVEEVKDALADEPPEAVPEEVKPPSPKKPIDPALQETDSSLLESIVSKPPLILDPKLDDTAKELNLKRGPRIADSILQKFNFISNNIESKQNANSEPSSSGTISFPSTLLSPKPIELKPAPIAISPMPRLITTSPEPGPSVAVDSKPKLCPLELKPKLVSDIKQRIDEKSLPKLAESLKAKSLEAACSELTKPEQLKTAEGQKDDTKMKKRRAISKPIVEESDSDSSDSENLIIRSDDEEDSQTNSSDNKPLVGGKGTTDSNLSLQKTLTATDDSQSQPESEEEKRNFTFKDMLPKRESLDSNQEPEKQIGDQQGSTEDKHVASKIETNSVEPTKEAEMEEEEIKEDPNLNSLLCEEELPRSPAPVPEIASVNEVVTAVSIHEMPFASAPGTSNSKILEPSSAVKKQPQSQAQPLAMERENRAEAETVIENTPPTTPESTISNMSPRGDNGNTSPNTNDSKSNEQEPEYVDPRPSTTPKVTPYSEEDTQAGGHEQPSTRKSSAESFGHPLGYRKRRRSLRNSEEGPSGSGGAVVPPKRTRRPRRERRDTDSDDASEENSTTASGAAGGQTPGSAASSVYERSARSPRPSRYNFFVEFDPSLDSNQRIAILQQKISELRKTYVDVKAELAAVERRRKKLRRREREGKKQPVDVSVSYIRSVILQ
ncbi:AT-rich interactive domain-containing protein 4B isoform X2 [Anthonomus grandis grandis]|uniref:AT-rich interactive domain-containing protein 4B isoform X2 n=1 Tax=Anthonomus grandis grandis TaxID=2921223 RepID=UPI0021666D86|nr:AT-rich interactive domain-containing protein 4B isoform X2 [Anthonomus grandis grandis]